MLHNLTDFQSVSGVLAAQEASKRRQAAGFAQRAQRFSKGPGEKGPHLMRAALEGAELK